MPGGAPAAAAPPARPASALAAAARLRQRLHRHDRRRGGEQRRAAFREPRVDERQAHAHRDRRDAGLLLAGIAYLAPRYRIGAIEQDRPGYQSVLSQLVRRGGRAAGRSTTSPSAAVLAVLVPVGQHQLRRFPPPLPDVAKDGFLPPAFAHQGAAAGVFGRHRLLAAVAGAPAGRLRRHHGPPDPAVRRGRVPGLHAVAAGDGGALAAATAAAPPASR